MTKRTMLAKQRAVAPDSVRVWSGFKLQSLSDRTFRDKLGTVFMPATVMIQAQVGLTAYLPTVLPKRKPTGVPDEIALVFYAYQDAYHEAKKTVGGRAYRDMHALVFDLKRSISGFPTRYDGTLKPDGRYHLFDQAVDWQSGHTTVFVGARKQESMPSFRRAVAEWVNNVQSLGAGAPDGAIVAFAPDYVIYWEHYAEKRSVNHSDVANLGQFVVPVLLESIKPVDLSQPLWRPFEGIAVGDQGKSFNFQFSRSPIKSR